MEGTFLPAFLFYVLKEFPFREISSRLPYSSKVFSKNSYGNYSKGFSRNFPKRIFKRCIFQIPGEIVSYIFGNNFRIIFSEILSTVLAETSRKYIFFHFQAIVQEYLQKVFRFYPILFLRFLRHYFKFLQLFFRKNSIGFLSEIYSGILCTNPIRY